MSDIIVYMSSEYRDSTTTIFYPLPPAIDNGVAAELKEGFKPLFDFTSGLSTIMGPIAMIPKLIDIGKAVYAFLEFGTFSIPETDKFAVLFKQIRGELDRLHEELVLEITADARRVQMAEIYRQAVVSCYAAREMMDGWLVMAPADRALNRGTYDDAKSQAQIAIANLMVDPEGQVLEPDTMPPSQVVMLGAICSNLINLLRMGTEVFPDQRAVWKAAVQEHSAFFDRAIPGLSQLVYEKFARLFPITKHVVRRFNAVTREFDIDTTFVFAYGPTRVENEDQSVVKPYRDYMLKIGASKVVNQANLMADLISSWRVEDANWYRCSKCHCIFRGPDNHDDVKRCPAGGAHEKDFEVLFGLMKRKLDFPSDEQGHDLPQVTLAETPYIESTTEYYFCERCTALCFWAEAGHQNCSGVASGTGPHELTANVSYLLHDADDISDLSTVGGFRKCGKCSVVYDGAGGVCSIGGEHTPSDGSEVHFLKKAQIYWPLQ